MMLYVFHVDVGRMMSFDMTVALSSVENLKDTIERLHGIPAANIVLLVSGGEMLTQSTQVSYYSAGTDTNPIYMFLTGDVRLPPAVPQSEPDLDLREQVERSLELPVCYDTVEKRAKIALRMHDLAREEDRLCERFVHEQHLQQQGWSAVVANMEDLTYDFRMRFRDFCSAFDRHLEKRSKYLELLRTFGEDLSKLERIPILPGLMPLAEADFHGFDKLLENDDVFSNTEQESVLVAGGANVLVQTNEAMLQAIDNKDVEKNKKGKIINEGEEPSGSGGTGLTVAPASGRRRSNSQSTNSTGSARRQNSLNLLQWITSKENHNALKLMSDECIQGLSTFNEDIYEKLKIEIQNIIKLAEQNDVKEIKGLGERLCKLEEFKYKIKGMVKDQKELSTALQQNQNRAMNLGDITVLPDLCASHQSQLLVMLQNHQKIRDLRRLIAKAKDELGVNLHTRLKRIVWIENAMSEFDNRLLFYHRCLRRAERHICIIEQIHQAPCIYVAAVTEVVRRRIFSGEFRDWASKLSEDFASIHSEEIRRRQLFNASFEGHFLNILFPGMHDMPPSFANDNSLVFDAGLPNLTKSDIDTLTSQLPDLATQIQLPDMDSVINFFVLRSGEDQKERMEELLKRQVAIALNIDLSTEEKPLQHQRVSDLQKEAITHASGDGGSGVAADVISTSVGCEECETDTETEFEQLPAATAVQTNTIATSTSENVQPVVSTMARSTATEPLLTQSAGTLTEQTELDALSEIARMRELLSSMSKAAMDCLRMARTSLGNFRVDAEMYRDDLQANIRSINDKWHQMHTKICENEQQLQEASNEQSNELQRLRETVQQRDSELLALRTQLEEIDSLRIKCATMETQMEELRDKLKGAQEECNMAVAEAREELIHEHKTEIESLRCRFKLMTSMERSPSDSSLEKIERPTSTCDVTNIIEFVHHEAILAQQRATFEAEKERAITAAIEIERSLWQSKIFPMNSESVMANANILKDMLEEKERQLEQLREKDLMLTKENFQLKTRLDALTNEEGNSWLQEKIEILKIAKNRLEEELISEKAKRLEMESSLTALKNSTYEPGILPRSKSSGSSQRYMVLESCSKGDIVFIVWSIRHGQFMVVQDSQNLYFVHADSLSSLNLRIPNQNEGPPDEISIPMPYYAVGRVIEKEYCQARKDENRYRVTRGSKFYRIKLEPISSRASIRRERLESHSSSTSRSISQNESQGESAGNAIPQQTQQVIFCAKMCVISNNQNNNKDTVDASTITSLGILTPIVTPTATATSSGQIALTNFKERTVSITSVTEEDDEPLSVRSERCHYTSVSEEDELPTTFTDAEVAALSDAIKDKPMPTTAAATPTTQQKLTQTVITEQPTATTTKELQLQLMLASVDITIQPQPQPQQIQQEESEEDNFQQDATITTADNETTITTCSDVAVEAVAIEKDAETKAVAEKEMEDDVDKTDQITSSQIVSPTTTSNINNINLDNTTATTISCSLTPINLPIAGSRSNQITASCGSPSIPTSIGTTSEDSDEFRSLESKDETDFPISE